MTGDIDTEAMVKDLKQAKTDDVSSQTPDPKPGGKTDETMKPSAEGPDKGPRRRGRDVIFALVALLAVFGLLEIVLRVVGFRFAPVPILVDAAWGPEQVRAMDASMGGNVFRRDDALFWSLKPGARLDTRTVNELGLLGDPIEIPKPAGAYRILCLGDSCTAMGPAPYTMSVQNRLKAVEGPGRRFEVINAGCYSYTSHQGYRLFRDRLSDVAPELVTVYYGWNDHYLTQSYPDGLLKSRNALVPEGIRVLRSFRIYQMVQKTVNQVQMDAIERERQGSRLVRVEPEDYRANLRAIVDLARARSARALLLTAPTSHRPGHVPAYFLDNKLAESEEALIARHRRYNAIVCEAAAEKKADLLDLAEAFDPKNKDGLFMTDGVHPNAAGRRLIAQLLLDKLGDMGILSIEDQERIAENPGYDSLDSNRLRSRLEIGAAPLRVLAGQSLDLAVKATNAGDTLWLARSDPVCGQVRLGVIIYDAEGTQLFERERVDLPRDVPPGESVELRWPISAIDEPGRYILEVAPVVELMTWFYETGDARTTTTLIVEPRGESGGTDR